MTQEEASALLALWMREEALRLAVAVNLALERAGCHR